jgi:hypothetical protein
MSIPGNGRVKSAANLATVDAPTGTKIWVDDDQCSYESVPAITVQTGDIAGPGEAETSVWRRISGTIAVKLPNATSVQASEYTLPPGCTAAGTVVSVFRGGQTAADVNLGTDASTAILAVTIAAGLAASSKFTATLGFRTVIWQGGTEANSGSMDTVVDIYITTDGASVATVVFQTVPFADTSRLLAALAGATMTAAASAGGFTISATRPAGVNCDCRAKWWVVQFEDIT